MGLHPWHRALFGLCMTNQDVMSPEHHHYLLPLETTIVIGVKMDLPYHIIAGNTISIDIHRVDVALKGDLVEVDMLQVAEEVNGSMNTLGTMVELGEDYSINISTIAQIIIIVLIAEVTNNLAVAGEDGVPGNYLRKSVNGGIQRPTKAMSRDSRSVLGLSLTDQGRSY